MSLPVTAEPLPSSYAFGKIVGRVIHLIADTAEDTDDKPQARAAAGKVTFSPKEVIRKTTEAEYPAIVLHAPETATLSSSGRILDAEGRQGIWLAAGIYTVTFEITKAPRAIPQFDIEVTTAHTDEAPLDLASEVPYVPPTGTVVQTVVIPSGGSEGQVLARTANGGAAWVDPSADVDLTGYATTTALSDGLATKVNSSTYTAGIDDAKARANHTGTQPSTTISDATTVGRSVLTATDAAAARTAIGAGTSNLTIGTTASTAKAGNYAPPTASTTVQGVVELATNTETTTGTDTARAVTPAGVKVELDKKANTTHTHTASAITDFTTAVQAVPGFGDAGNVLVLGASDPVPPGTEAGTVIFREV